MSRGFPDATLFVRDTGTIGAEEEDWVRCGGWGTCGGDGRGGELPFVSGRDTEATSIDCARTPGSALIAGGSLRGGSAVLLPQDANID